MSERIDTPFQPEAPPAAPASLFASPRRRTLWILAAFLCAYALVVFIAYREMLDYAVEQAGEQIRDALLTHRAMHSYVEEVQKPEIYRLQEAGHLYPGYFSPEVLSFTYIARNVYERLNDERLGDGLEPVYFKLASDNPRNPVNAADAHERELLRRMNQEGLSEYRELHREAGSEPTLYYALPIAANQRSCMRCHGDPEDAPAELLAMYGREAGFHETVGRVRAMVSIRVPLAEDLATARRGFYWIAAVAFAAMATIYGLISVFLHRLDAKSRALEWLSSSDPLTGLHNRLRFRRDLEREFALARRHGHSLGLILMDLDHFKDVNDTFGHCVGDEVLVNVARRLRGAVRSTDLLARWGGEELIVACPNTDLEGTAALAEKLCRLVGGEPVRPGLRVTLSAGVTGLAAGDDIRWLVDRADRALYRAKAAGRDCVRVLEAEPDGAGAEPAPGG